MPPVKATNPPAKESLPRSGRAAPARPHRGNDGRGAIRQRNEAKLLKTAEAVFAEKGFEGATTADIAARARLPKANLHYYFGTKENLYRAVIASILELWLGAFDKIRPDAEPAEAITAYVRAKVLYSKQRPLASKVFANELISGGRIIADFLQDDLRAWVEARGALLRRWARDGKMDPVDPAHFFFLIWAATQTYADFGVQVGAVLGRDRLRDDDYEAAIETITHIVLKGCGIVR